MSEVTIRIYEVIGTPLAVASDDGQMVHYLVAKALREGQKVKLSFYNLESLTSAFLNAAIGQLYGAFGEEQIRRHLSVTDIYPDDALLLRRVVERAKEYFNDPERFKVAVQEVFGDDVS